MVTDLRFIVKDGKKILQMLAPARITDMNDEYLTISIADMQWQDIPLESHILSSIQEN